MSIFNLFLLCIIIILILISGFLSGSETAITAASKARIISKIKKGSQKAEYLKEHGMVDIVCHRKDLKNNLTRVLNHITK